MKNVIYLIINYGAHALFVVLEIICFYLVITYNREANAIFINTSNTFTTKVNKRVDRWQEYLKLEEVNDSLQAQNARLIRKLIAADITETGDFQDSINLDSLQYQLIPVKICNSTFNLKNNYLTLCAGSKQGITKDMGIISLNGVVGQVINVSDNYSSVMSLLHSQSKVSASIHRNNAYGTIRWSQDSPTEVFLEAIPKHMEVVVGDTVVTSGFSTIFPKGIEIGRVIEANMKNNNYLIRVRLSNDPSKWDVVYAIKNHFAEEQKQLESQLPIE